MSPVVTLVTWRIFIGTCALYQGSGFDAQWTFKRTEALGLPTKSRLSLTIQYVKQSPSESTVLNSAINVVFAPMHCGVIGCRTATSAENFRHSRTLAGGGGFSGRNHT